MARLNEPPALVDSFDNLRRKFLRQNRDIARVNSNQSLRIRGLENECARLLSENLELRGQVLRLEKELDDDKSQRVADHALQIKEKMEAQLVELGSLLASFGLEPPTKRQSSPTAARRADKPARLSLSSETMSPLQRKPPALSPSEAESLAIQEGRLPPIYETKTFPRKTLSRDEILALQSDDSEVASPVLGPPPVSRLVREDPIKSMEPTKKTTANNVPRTETVPKAKATVAPREPTKERKVEEAAPAKAQTAPTSNAMKPKPEVEKKTATARPAATATKTTPSSPETSTVPIVAPSPTPASVSSTPASKAVGKRKFAVNDENAAIRGMKAGDANMKASVPIEGGVHARELKNPRSIRSLVNSRKESNENHGEIKTAAGGRKPLSVKSTNEDISTPRKQGLTEGKPKGGHDANAKPNADKAAHLNSRMRNRTKAPLVVEIPDAPPPVTVDIKIGTDAKNKVAKPLPSDEPVPTPTDIDNESLPEPETEAPCPRTPTPLTTTTLLTSQRLIPTHAEGRDTPPPTDISFQGETSRPNRRSRASVSYAEPNLRDKMRRPTKELFDAVAGEGKYVQRQSHQPQLDGQDAAAIPPVAKADLVIPIVEAQPLKEEKATQPQQVADTEKRRPRASSASEQKTPADASSSAADQDPYEFTVSSSPSQETEDEESEASMGKGRGGSRKSTSSRASLKTTRRSSSVNTKEESASVVDRHTRPSAARKRNSMVSMKRGSMLDSDEEDDAADSSYEPPSEKDAGETIEGRALSTRDRISRRRSMML